MKHLFSFFLALAVTFSAIGQISQKTITLPEFSHELTSLFPKHEQKLTLKSAKEVTEKLEYILVNELNTTTNQFEQYEKIEYTYDTVGNLLMEVYSGLNDQNQFIKDEKHDYQYDQDSRLIYEDRKFWDNDNQTWYNMENYSYEEHWTYNTAGKVEENTYYSNWNTTTEQWDKISKRTYSYDADNDLTEYVYTIFNSSTSQWDNNSKAEYEYNADKKNTKITYSNWDSDNSQWLLSYEKEYTYNDQGILTTETQSYFNATDNVWVLYKKNEYTYDANGNYSLITTYRWDTDVNEWGYDSKMEFVYDNNQNQTDVITSRYNNGQWEYENKDHYTYDLSITKDQTFYPKDLEEDRIFTNKMTGIEYLYFKDGDWVCSSIIALNYSSLLASIKNNINERVSVYPNPATDKVTFTLPENAQNTQVEFYNTNGQKVSAQQLNNNSAKVNNLAKGMYIYKLTYDNKTVTGKILIK